MTKRNITIPEFRNKEEFGLFLLAASVKQSVENKTSYNVGEMRLIPAFSPLVRYIDDRKVRELEDQIRIVPAKFKRNGDSIGGSITVFNVLLNEEVVFDINLTIKDNSGTLFDSGSEYLDLIFKRYKRCKTEAEKAEYISFQLEKHKSEKKIRTDYVSTVCILGSDGRYVEEFSSKLLELYNKGKLDYLKVEEKKMNGKEKLEKKISKNLEEGNFNTCDCLGLGGDQDLGNKVAEKIIGDGIGAIIGGIAKVNGAVNIKGKIGIKISADIDIDFANISKSENPELNRNETVKGSFKVKETGAEVEIDLSINGNIDADINANADIR